MFLPGIVFLACQAEALKANSGLVCVIVMYLPIAFYKNNLVLIDNMETFALYFCSSVKQKMKPAPGEGHAGYDGEGMPGEPESDEEIGGTGFSSDESFAESFDDDDDL